MNRRISASGALAAAFLLLFAGDCSDGIDGSKLVATDDPAEDSGIETDLTDPEAVIEAQSRAWSEQNFEAYQALLDDEFEFSPLYEDVLDFPWMSGSDSWGRTIELEMALNMFDDNYSQGNGAVDLIEMDTPIEAIETHDDSRVEVTARTVGRVMWTASDGASFDTRQIFELVPRDGFLRIRRIEEIPRTVAGRDHPMEASSWGGTKALYR